MKNLMLGVLFTAFAACSNHPNIIYPTLGSIVKVDAALDRVISPGAKIEIIAEGMTWSEGPLWVEKYHMLLFSDVTQNTIYKWTPENGKEVYLKPSGYTGSVKRGGEQGSNGLLLNHDGNLVICQQGDRRIVRMDSDIAHPSPNFKLIVAGYKGKRISSPNDAVYNKQGELYFVDPPYGLQSQTDDDPQKEIPFNGIYKVKKNGEVVLLIDSLTRPNGIAFMPGEKQLIISNSDPKKANWYIYDVVGDSLKNSRIFYHIGVTTKMMKGVPDGLKIDKRGNVFASGPNGVWIFDKAGKLLGNIKVPEFTSNIALSPDEKKMYITSDMYILRVRMRN